MSRAFSWVGVLAVAALIGGCWGGRCDDCALDSPPPQFSIPEGLAQKGPLLAGSVVIIRELDAALQGTARVHETRVGTAGTASGRFATAARSRSAWVEVSAVGAYLDEFSGRAGDGTVTLTGLNDLGVDVRLNVNVLTTMARSRIARLVAVDGLPFARAREQAEGEVLAAFGVRGGNRFGAFSTLSLGGRSEGDRILAAITGLVAHGNDPAGASAVLAAVQSDIALNGSISREATRAVLAASAQRVNLAQLALALKDWFGALSATPSARELGEWLDTHGDGVIARHGYVVPDADVSPTFALPPSLVDGLAGTSLQAVTGQLHVAGVAVTGPVTLRPGEAVALSPPPTWATPGVLTVHLLADGRPAARVTFLRGLRSLQVLPASTEMRVGTELLVRTIGTFEGGTTRDLSTVAAWDSSAADIAMPSALGRVIAARAGHARIVASVAELAASADVTVTAGAPVTALALALEPAATGVGIARRIVAKARFADGSQRDVSALAGWRSASSEVATVTAGWVTGQRLGRATIVAQYEGVEATLELAVTANSWTALTPPTTDPSYVASAAVPLADGRIWFMDAGATQTAHIFDPDSGQWSVTAPNPTKGREVAAALRLADGRVLVMGRRSGGIHYSADLYDPDTDTWRVSFSVKGWNKSKVTLLMDGRVLVTGGCSAGGGPDCIGFDSLSSSDFYDPFTDRWRIGSMNHARLGHTSTLLADGRVLVTGGGDGRGSSIIDGGYRFTRDSAEIYDPVADRWTLVAPMTKQRGGHIAIRLTDGRVLVMGRRDAEVYDPKRDAWTATVPIDIGGGPDFVSRAVLMADGSVLLLLSRYGAWARYDPGTNSWSAEPPMPTTRQSWVHTVLPGGALLVVGGLATPPGGGAFGTDRVVELYWR